MRRLHVYNAWANERVLEAMDGMSAEEFGRERAVSYGSLRAALWHMLGAQMGWLHICAGYDTWSKVNIQDSTSLEGMAKVMRQSHVMWRDFLESLSEERILSPAELPIDHSFRRSVEPDLLAWSEKRGHRPRRPLWQSVLHVVNHSTQHRGDIGMRLDSLGRSPGDLDYGTFEEYRAVRPDWKPI